MHGQYKSMNFDSTIVRPSSFFLKHRNSRAAELDQSSVSDNYYFPVEKSQKPLKAHNIQK